ncbi:hypothetical protein KY339_00705 [Candidatus Woesearchaeota archaeon]|nr:hypothetical protein [Candidatus Woesearchaeota archaeon]
MGFPEGENYNLILKDKGKKTAVVGIAAENIIVKTGRYRSEALINNQTVITYIDGNHSAKPSFNIQLDHDISYYKELIKYIKGTETVQGLMLSAAICAQTGALDTCIKEKVNEINQKPEMKDNGWELKFGSENCDNEYEQAYHKIAGAYLECLNSPDDDCKCSIPNVDIDDFKIRFLQDGSDVTTRIDSGETINKEPLILTKIPNTNLCMIESESDVDFKDVPRRNIQNIEEIPTSLYKKDRLCFVGNLEEKAEEQYEEKKACTLQPKSFKFCLDTKQKVFAQDKSEDKKDFIPVILRFALLFEDQT